MLLPNTAAMFSVEDGADGWSTTLWKSDTVRFVFGHLNVGNSNLNQRQMQRWRQWMCMLCTTGVCWGICALTHTFGRVVYTPEGIKSVLSIEMAVVGLNGGMGSRRYPRFFCTVANREWKTFLTLGYQSDQLLLTDARKIAAGIRPV